MEVMMLGLPIQKEVVAGYQTHDHAFMQV